MPPTDTEFPSTNVVVTARKHMNILREDPEASLQEALETEIEERMTAERAKAFFEDAVFNAANPPAPEYPPSNNDERTVDVRFTPEGMSISVYGGENNAVLEEGWLTWAEIEDRKQTTESDITFEI